MKPGLGIAVREALPCLHAGSICKRTVKSCPALSFTPDRLGAEILQALECQLGTGVGRRHLPC